MIKWFIGIIAFLILVLFSGLVLLYQFGGLKYYLRATSFINKLPTIERIETSRNFHSEEKNVYSGTLAGTWNNKVWVWGKKGLKNFNVDQYSVYSYTDGCNNNVPKNIEREVIFDFNIWNQKARMGDFVVVLTTGEANGGVLGNLREIYTFNWWTFMGKDMITQCEK